MYRATVLSKWIFKDRAYQPDVFRFLRSGESGSDITGEPAPVDTPHPNPVVVELLCGEETLSTIEEDPDHGKASILSVEVMDEIPEISQ